MEGGDNQEHTPEAVIPPENSPAETPSLETKPEESSGALTDSILDDDLVVIPSQDEKIEDEDTKPEQPDIVPAEPSPPSAPEPPASVPESEPKPSQPDVSVTQRQSVPPPQPNPEPRAQTTRPQMASKQTPKAIEEDDDDDFEDETLMERLAGLTEMFPDTLRTFTGVTFSLSVTGLKKLFNFSRSALWIGSTSFMILILPIVFETEMVHMEQAQIQRQKQILLGPNAATAGGMTGGLTPPMPGVAVAAPPPDSR